MTGIRSAVPVSSAEYLPVRNVTRTGNTQVARSHDARAEGDVAFDLEPAAAAPWPRGAERQELTAVRATTRPSPPPREEDRHHRDRRKRLTRAWHLLSDAERATVP